VHPFRLVNLATRLPVLSRAAPPAQLRAVDKTPRSIADRAPPREPQPQSAPRSALVPRHRPARQREGEAAGRRRRGTHCPVSRRQGSSAPCSWTIVADKRRCRWACCAWRRGTREDAERSYERALQRHPGSFRAHANQVKRILTPAECLGSFRAHANQVETLRAQGKLEEAEQHLAVKALSWPSETFGDGGGVASRASGSGSGSCPLRALGPVDNLPLPSLSLGNDHAATRRPGPQSGTGAFGTSDPSNGGPSPHSGFYGGTRGGSGTSTGSVAPPTPPSQQKRGSPARNPQNQELRTRLTRLKHPSPIDPTRVTRVFNPGKSAMGAGDPPVTAPTRPEVRVTRCTVGVFSVDGPYEPTTELKDDFVCTFIPPALTKPPPE